MMHELLPFGEYVPPERAQPSHHMYVGLESWELDQILARLAVSAGAPALNRGRRRGQARAEAVIVPGRQRREGKLSTILRPFWRCVHRL